MAATAVLDAGSAPPGPAAPAGEPAPTGTPAVDCQGIAGDIERARAETERERREALGPSASPAHRGGLTARAVVVPEECAGEFQDRGLMTR